VSAASITHVDQPFCLRRYHVCMMAMLRSAVLVLGLASCVSTPLPASPHAPSASAAAAPDRHGERCSLDADCPSGSCRSGTCSWVAAGEPQRDVCPTEVICYGRPGACAHAGICAPPLR
jgi:hypothetical protein